jgi:hypothetical protein
VLKPRWSFHHRDPEAQRGSKAFTTKDTKDAKVCRGSASVSVLKNHDRVLTTETQRHRGRSKAFTTKSTKDAKVCRGSGVERVVLRAG